MFLFDEYPLFARSEPGQTQDSSTSGQGALSFLSRSVRMFCGLIETN
jgi:hypothetical protein